MAKTSGSRFLLYAGLGAVALGVLAYSMGTKKAPPAPLPQPTPQPGDPNWWNLPAGLKALVDDSLPGDVAVPIVLVLHGRDGTADQLRPLVPEDLFAHVYYIRGPIETSKNRWAYFDAKYAQGPDVLTPQLLQATKDFGAVIQDLKTNTMNNGKVYVLGGSQGGHIALALARAGLVDGAVAVSGALPPNLYPVEPKQARVVGIHGTKDTVVPYAAGKATNEAFKLAGYPQVEWVPIEGGGHALGDKAVKPAQTALKAMVQ